MPRLRNVGKQAANPLDLAQIRDINALATTAAATYVPLNSANQGTGYAKLDSNARLLNAQMPTDPSFTTAKTTGKATLALLDVSSTANLNGNANVGGSLSAVGAMTGASLDVGSGAVSAATAAIPEITTATFKAKATTLDSLTVSGQSNLAALNLSGNLVAQGVSATAVSSSGGVTATGEVNGATVHATGSLIADGATSLQAATVAGALTTQAITAAQQIRANGGVRLGVGATLSQVDASNNNVPVKIAGGLDVNGPLSNVTALSLSNLTISGTPGTLSTSGKATFADLESQAGAKFSGALTGITDLTMLGNLSVQGAGKQISATAISTGTLSASGATTLAGLTATGLTLNGNGTVSGTLGVTGAVTVGSPTAVAHAARYGDTFIYLNRRYPAAKPTINHNQWTPIDMDSWQFTNGGVTAGGTQYTVASGYDGVWYVGANIKFAYRNNAGSKIMEIAQSGTPIAWQDCATYDGYLHCSALVYASAGDVFTLSAFQFTGSSLQIERCFFEMHRMRK